MLLRNVIKQNFKCFNTTILLFLGEIYQRIRIFLPISNTFVRTSVLLFQYLSFFKIFGLIFASMFDRFYETIPENGMTKGFSGRRNRNRSKDRGDHPRDNPVTRLSLYPETIFDRYLRITTVFIGRIEL